MEYIGNRILICFGLAGVVFVLGIIGFFAMEDKAFAGVPFGVSIYLVVKALQLQQISRKNSIVKRIGVCKDKQAVKLLLQKSEEWHFTCEDEAGSPYDLFVTGTPKVIDSKGKRLVAGVRYQLLYFGQQAEEMDENPLAIIRLEGTADV